MCYPSKYSSCIPSCLLPYPNFSHGFVARILWGSSIGGPKNDPLGLQNHQNYPKKSFSFNHSKWEYRWIHCVYIGNIEYRFIVFGRWRQAILSTCRFFNLALEKKETDSSFFSEVLLLVAIGAVTTTQYLDTYVQNLWLPIRRLSLFFSSSPSPPNRFELLKEKKKLPPFYSGVDDHTTNWSQYFCPWKWKLF